MADHPRYEIIDTIGRGDFATVFHGRDKELGREVAIKQIHQQYLDDPQQLERYWKEAQLMATLQHPHIMTIYDVVRDRGWLILELMQGSLKQLLSGHPIDLKDLRLALKYTLRALSVLAENGIVHGDVKPGNLLVDRNHRVKLGDFGIARRIAGDEGSVVKGTTKYMAPEVVSDQFGEVGPHSDLYSLGFTAFELMCGENFESLFPGLDIFGRDRQIAWMMWHSAPDRRLPEIQRVLEGVPDDLARIVEKLTEKDPQKRYRTAQEALDDLRSGETPSEEEAESKEAAATAPKTRLFAIGALVVSVILSLAVLFMPTGGKKPADNGAAQRPSEGVISEIDIEGRQIFLELRPGVPPHALVVRPDVDRIRLNNSDARFADLARGDELEIQYLTRQDGSQFKEIIATRPTAVEDSGVIETINAGAGVLTFLAAGGETPLRVYVPTTADISLNGFTEIGGRKVTLGDLKPADRAVIHHSAGDDGRRARSVSAQRLVDVQGRLVSVDATKRRVRVRAGEDSASTETELPVSPDCEITLNGVSAVEGRVLGLGDLKAEDEVSIRHDASVVKIDAIRSIVASGVVKRVDYDERRLVATLGESLRQTEFALDPDCAITILASGRPVDLTFVRIGDRVQITHDSADLKDAQAMSISVDAQPDRRAWAIVIGQQQYDDQRVSRLDHTVADAQLVRDVLAAEYRVPADQLVFLRDVTRTRLEQTLKNFLPKITSGEQLIAYFVGHAYVDDTGAPFLATKGIDIDQIARTGLSLRWLVEQVEAVSASEKLLLLDACHEGDGRDRKWVAPTAELVDRLRPRPGRAPSTSVTLVASCDKGQLGLNIQRDEQKHALFGFYIAEAFAGRADEDRDHRVTSDELFRFLKSKMAGHGQPQGPRQTPVRFLPDPTPPRLSPEAIAAARGFLNLIWSGRVSDEDLEEVYKKTRSLAPGQPDIELAFALLNLRQNRTSVSLRVFETVRRRFPELLLPYHALAWQHFMRDELEIGLDDLAEMVQKMPPPRGDRELTPYERHVLEFAGQLRAFALYASDSSLTSDDAASLDQAVLGRKDEASTERYKAGIDQVRQAITELDDQIRAATSPNEQTRMVRDRQRLTYYTKFDFAPAVEYVQQLLQQ